MDRQSLIVWLEGPHEPAAGDAPGAKGSRGRSHLGANGPASEEVAGGSVTAARAEPARTRCARAAGARRAAGRRATEARAPRAAEGARIDVISARALGDARTAGRRAARRSQRRGGERSRRTTASASAVRGSAVATVGSPCSCVWHHVEGSHPTCATDFRARWRAFSEALFGRPKSSARNSAACAALSPQVVWVGPGPRI